MYGGIIYRLGVISRYKTDEEEYKTEEEGWNLRRKEKGRMGRDG